jgi:hypothetical protein
MHMGMSSNNMTVEQDSSISFIWVIIMKRLMKLRKWW